MKKRFLSLALVVVMLAGVLVGCGGTTTTTPTGTANTTPTGTGAVTINPAENKVILGSTTTLSGDFRFPGWGGSSAGASDQDINRLTAGYSTMEKNKAGTYVWNDTVVKSHTEEEDENGNYVITIEIKPGLKFSNGTELKAINFLAYVLAFSSPVVQDASHPGMAGQAFVGFDAFNGYVGEITDLEAYKAVVKAADLAAAKAAFEADEENEGKTFDEAAWAEAWEKSYQDPSQTKEFSGVRLLGDYKFSMTIAAPNYYPYYYAYTYGAVSPYPVDLILGEGASIADDGNGAYITGNWYDKDENGVSFTKKAHIEEARFDITKYAFSGPYTITEWDEGTKTATLKINPEYAGNFEGQKPSIETIVYIELKQETQLQMLKTGGVDVIAGVTGGSDTDALLAAVEAENSGLAYVSYQRAGYGKIQFDCDFGPTQFASVRKAVAHVLNTVEFADTFTGGYGQVVYGPYSPDFDVWKTVKDTITLKEYTYSVENANKVLEDDGWVYNSKGEAYVAGQTGVDAVRYKKLTAEEAANEMNINFASVENSADGVEYKTVKVGEDYYMPLVINWFGTSGNDVTDLIATKLVGTADVKAIGMVVRNTVGDFDKLLGEIYREPAYGFDGNVRYGMFNLATGWNTEVYDYSFNWSLDPIYFPYSSNKLFDEYDVDFPYYDEDGNHIKLSYTDAMARSGGKLGMDYLSMAMVYDATTKEEYAQWWQAYIERWNELLPDIPLYSNIYFDGYNAKIQNFKTTPFFGPADAILYSTIG